MTGRTAVKVSVIIPTYNRSALACKTVESALAQSMEDVEIIVVDDGSTDDTPQKMAAFGDRIHYVRQQNGGVNNARNHALRLARGEYIATLDNDDLWKPHKLALQARVLDQFTEVAYTFSNFSIYRSDSDITENGMRTWFDSAIDWKTFYADFRSVSILGDDEAIRSTGDSLLYFGDLYHASLSHYYVLPSTAMFRRSMMYDDIRFIEHDPICGDWDFFARMSKRHPVAYLDYDTTYNRSHGNEYRLTRTAWSRQLAFRIDMIERLYMQDQAFYSRYRSEVDAVYLGYMRALTRHQLMEGNHRAARDTLAKYRSHSGGVDLSYLIMRTASYIPGMSAALNTLHTLRNLRG